MVNVGETLIEAAKDAALIQRHITQAQIVRNAISSGLTAQDIIEGVKLSHEEYLDLVHRAIRLHCGHREPKPSPDNPPR